jgi:hypothetical protein
MGEGKITSSLLPARIRRERMWQEKTKFFAAAAALFVLGTGIGYASIFLNRMSFESSEPTQARGDIQRIYGQAQDLDQKWSAIQGAGAADRQRIVNIRSLTDYRDLYTSILADLHSSVPVMRGTLEETKKTPRGQRQQLFIENIVNRYVPDLGVVTDLKQFGTLPQGNAPTPMPTMGGFGGGLSPGAMGMGMGMESAMMTPTPAEGEAAPATTGQRGFVISVFGTTPNTKVSFVTETFIKTLQTKLSKEKIPANKQYYIEKAQIIHLQPLERSPQKLQQIKAAFEAAVKAKETGTFTVPGVGGGGFGGPMGGYGRMGEVGMEGESGFGGYGGGYGVPSAAGDAAAQAAQDRAYKDRNFIDEDIRQDQEFIAVITIALDPPPKDAAPPADEAAPAEAAAAQ